MVVKFNYAATKPFLWVAFLFACMTTAAAEEKPSAVSGREHRQMLNRIQERADSFYNYNLNRFGLYNLQQYDALLDSLYRAEINDSVAALSADYNSRNKLRNEKLDSLNNLVEGLTTEKDEAGMRLASFLKKLALASVLWLVIAWLYLRYRSKKLKASRKRLKLVSEQLQLSEERVQQGNQLVEQAAAIAKQAEACLPLIDGKIKSVAESTGASAEVIKAYKQPLGGLHQFYKTVSDLCQSVVSHASGEAREPDDCDINRVCNGCFELVYQSFHQTNETAIKATRDLEKKNPHLKLEENKLQQVLVPILVNAFESIQTRLQRNEKGYQPQVSISTRILPRFVQIRIKDNGTGMKDEALQQVFREFYSAGKQELDTGLGLTLANNLVTSSLNGELKIESHQADGTDVYIKLFTSSRD